jgi:hypothetical protein
MIAESGSSYLLSPTRGRSLVDGDPALSGRELLLTRHGVANLVGEYHGDLAAQFAGSTSRLKRENEPSKPTVVALGVKLDRFRGQLRQSSRPDCASSCTSAAKVPE